METGYLKLFGGVLIISAGILSGLYLSRRLRARTAILGDLILSLTALQNEISFVRAPLGEAFLRLSRIDGEVGRFYLRCHEGMKRLPRPSVYSIWEESLKLMFEPMMFSSEEYDAMLSLGRELGTGDVSAQLRAIRFTAEELSRIRKGAEADEKKKKRMYMGLSIIAAAVIVIAAA